jgi:CheY-like chemotaxis protein
LIAGKRTYEQVSKRILVVEDQADNRRILRDLLTSAGYEIIEAENGQEALRRCDRINGATHERNLLRCMSPVVAHRVDFGWLLRRPELGVKQTYCGHRRNGAVDP